MKSSLLALLCSTAMFANGVMIDTDAEIRVAENLQMPKSQTMLAQTASEAEVASKAEVAVEAAAETEATASVESFSTHECLKVKTMNYRATVVHPIFGEPIAMQRASFTLEDARLCTGYFDETLALFVVFTAPQGQNKTYKFTQQDLLHK